MRKIARKAAIAAAAMSVMLCCTACGEKPYYITFENLSGVAISEIHATKDSDKSDVKNLLTEALPDGETVTLEVGRFKEDYVDDGFYIVAYNAEDGSYQEFHMLMVKNGGLVSFYMDAIELCVAVDCTREEIEEMIAESEEDYAQTTVATTTAETTTTTTTADTTVSSEG